MLYEDMINMQRRQMNFKDGKQPLPVQPPTIPDSKVQMYKPSHPASTQQRPETYGKPVYVDHKQLHDMSHQSLLSYAQNLSLNSNNHSRESSASSTHTIKAHSRDNSLSSQGQGSSQGVYGAYQPQQVLVKVQNQHPQGVNMHPNITDRRIHNTSTNDMRPFPGAEPLTDPGGSRVTDAQGKGGVGRPADCSAIQ